MTLTAKDVAEITRLIEESEFDELILELDGLKLTLRRRGGAMATTGEEPCAPAPAPQPGVSHAHSTGEAAPAGSLPVPVVPAPSMEAGAMRNVTAPLLGTFYRAPKPGAPPFVEVGSAVEEDTIIGIIEVMKLMNTVRAGMRGTVMDILAEDGVLVEFGQTLVRIGKAVSA